MCVALRAFRAPRDVSTVFGGRDLLDDPTMVDVFRGLLDPRTKPFECVGTRDECAVALALAARRAASPPLVAAALGDVALSGGALDVLDDVDAAAAPRCDWWDGAALYDSRALAALRDARAALESEVGAPSPP